MVKRGGFRGFALDKRGPGTLCSGSMKARFSLVVVSAALWVAGAAVVRGGPADPVPFGMSGVARFDGDGQPTQEDLNRAFSHALNYLASVGDEEAKGLIKQAQENNGQIQVTADQAKAIVDRAAKTMQNGGKLEQPAGGTAKEDEEKAKEEDAKPLSPPAEERVKKAIALLAKEGDEDAKQTIEDFKKTRKLDISDKQGWEFISRAVAKGLMKAEDGDPEVKTDEADKPKEGDKPKAAPEDGDKEKPDMDRAEEAVKALAKKGDKEAKAVIDRARRNRGEMDLSSEEATTFIDRAVEKKLLKSTKLDPEDRLPPQQVKQLIKTLAERGDRDAKAIMRKAKKNDDDITYTPEEEKVIMDNARKAGLIN